MKAAPLWIERFWARNDAKFGVFIPSTGKWRFGLPYNHILHRQSLP